MLDRIWSWMKKVGLDIFSHKLPLHPVSDLQKKVISEITLEKGPSTVSTNVNFPSFRLEEKSLLTRKPLAPLGERSSGFVQTDIKIIAWDPTLFAVNIWDSDESYWAHLTYKRPLPPWERVTDTSWALSNQLEVRETSLWLFNKQNYNFSGTEQTHRSFLYRKWNL